MTIKRNVRKKPDSVKLEETEAKLHDTQVALAYARTQIQDLKRGIDTQHDELRDLNREIEAIKHKFQEKNDIIKNQNRLIAFFCLIIMFGGIMVAVYG